jgi:hypothetical protein
VSCGVIKQELVKKGRHPRIGWCGETAGATVAQVPLGFEQRELAVANGLERPRRDAEVLGCRLQPIVRAATAMPSGTGVPKTSQSQLLTEAVHLQQIDTTLLPTAVRKLTPAQPAHLIGVHCGNNAAGAAGSHPILGAPVRAGAAQPRPETGSAPRLAVQAACTGCAA